jgi:uncharacterized protein (DUF885 family)
MPQSEANAAFDRLADRIVDAMVELDPVEASWLGIHGSNDARLPDRSRGACERFFATLQNLLKELNAVREKDLSVDRLVDLRLARGGLTARLLRLQRHPCWREAPGSYVDDVVFGLYSLMIREYAPAAKRAKAILGRMGDAPQLLAQARVNLDNPSPIFTEAATLSAKGAIDFIDTAFKGFIARIEEPRLQAQLEKAAAETRGALESYREWLEGSLMPRSKGEFTIGRPLFERLLMEEHVLDWSADDLIAIGQRVYQETMREMKRVAARIDPSRPWSKVVENLKREHPRAEEIVQIYASEMKRAQTFVQKKGLVTTPEGESIQVVPTPEFARPMFPYAAYLQPAPFELEQKGTFWVTTVDEKADAAHRDAQLRGHATHGIAVIALHEAYPGHHMQQVRANQLPGHRLRHLFPSSSFAEGWALYCEDLMYTHGFYTDDRARLLQLKDLLWRACRVIIDVELQTGRMGFNEAVTFLVRKAHIERPNAVAEVRRYCANPTQPMSYVAGKIQIQELLEDYRAAKGNRFDLREFHDELLSHGTIPVELVRVEMGIPRREPADRRRRRGRPATRPATAEEAEGVVV